MSNYFSRFSTSDNCIQDTFEIPTLYQKLNSISRTEQIEILDFQKNIIAKIANITDKEEKEVLYWIIAIGYNNTLDMFGEEMPETEIELEKLKNYG